MGPKFGDGFQNRQIASIGNATWGKANSLGIIWHRAVEVDFAWQVHHATIATPVTVEASAIGHGGSEMRC